MIDRSPFRVSDQRNPRRWRRVLAAGGRTLTLAALVYLLAGALPACHRTFDDHYITTSHLVRIGREPTVRVRIAKGINRVRLDGPKRLRFRSPGHHNRPSHERTFESPVRVDRENDQFVIRSNHGQAITWTVPQILVQPDYGSTVRVDGVAYPQRIVLWSVRDQPQKANRFDVVNHVAMERYLPGVLHRELYRNWPLSTFKAQAVAARSYALVQCAQNWRRHFDLESTTASQVYGGSSGHARAQQAARQTRGLVLAFGGHILCAYYSSCCGGVGQDAATAFPNGANIRPLWGQKHGTWCAISPHHRWGPVLRNRLDLSQRLATWGRANKHPMATSARVAQIEVTGRSPVGRPLRFKVTDDLGQSFVLKPEAFRAACNFQFASLTPLPKASRLKSSHLDIQISGDNVRFTGRGHGHGVGMCQWGACAMAKRGHDSQAILAFYYPGTRVKRLY